MHYVVIGLLLVCQTALAQPDPFPRVAAAYLVQLNGSPLWGKDTARRLAPASLTKLMTALLVLEHSRPREVVTISRQAAAETGTRLGLRQGDRLRVADLLGAALIASSNDACHALADHVAGDQARFVRLMNRRARTLGLRHSHFVNACGHDAQGHYSSAEDLALLANEALKSKLLADLAATGETRIATVDGGRSFPLENRNALIGRYRGALGLKTGYTPAAGKCLIAYAQREGKTVLLVLLNAPNRWWDAVDILDLAFAHDAGAS